MELWNEYTDREDRGKIKKVLDAFNRITDDLLTLSDAKYITKILQSSPEVKDRYFNFIRRCSGLVELSVQFEVMRSILFGDNFDWEEVSKTLEKEEK